VDLFRIALKEEPRLCVKQLWGCINFDTPSSVLFILWHRIPYHFNTSNIWG